MKKQFKYIAATTVVFSILIFGISSNFYRIIYIKDSFISFLINRVPPFKSPKEIRIIPYEDQKKYISPYTALPKHFYYSGPFLFYRAPADITVKDLISQAIIYTQYLYSYRMEQAFRALNNITESRIPAGDTVLIPSPHPALVVDIKNKQRPSLIYTKGLYFTGYSMQNGLLLENLDTYKNHDINTIVFDARDITGIITYKSSLKDVITLDTHRHRSVDNMPQFIRILKEKGFYTVARIAVFRDHLLVENDPSLAIHSYRTGDIWNRGSKEIWCDPTNKRVQDYAIRISLELVDMGVDEIQFDYIRFPTVGNLADAVYRYDFGKMSKKSTIAHFLKRAYNEISQHKALLSIDIFGVVAWGKNIDIQKTGQQIDMLAQYCDVISPMLYPSHFSNDFEGFSNPGDNPYHFIYNGCVRVLELSHKQVLVRPWLQAFNWRVSRYDSNYILEQVRASHDSGARGYLFWNAKNRYDEVLEAMEKIKQPESD